MRSSEPVTHHRTQLYLPASLYYKVKKKIKEEDISLAEFIREVLRKELGKEEEVGSKGKEQAWKKFLAAAGIAAGPKDLSYNHDKYFKAS